jgi:RHS repeat-associated protein
VDNESGLMPLGNGERYYAPNMGSFIQQDSLAGGVDEPASLNRYAYAQDNPSRFTDPSGHFPILIPFLIGIAIGVAISSYEQNSEIRAGTRRPQDYSLSEALVNYTPVGGAYRFATGSDPVTLEQLSVKRRVFEGVMLAMDFAPVLEELQPLARLGRIGRSSAEVIEEGSHLANTTRRALTTTAEKVSAEKGVLSALEEATHLRSGMSKAERAVEETVKASRQAGKAELGELAGESQGLLKSAAKAKGEPFAFGSGSRSARAERIVDEAAEAAGIDNVYDYVDEIGYDRLSGSPYFDVDPGTGKRYLMLSTNTFEKTAAGQLIDASHELAHAQQYAKVLNKLNGDFKAAYQEVFINRPRGSWRYAHDETVVERLARARVSRHLGGLSPQQVGASTKYIRDWRNAYHVARSGTGSP